MNGHYSGFVEEQRDDDSSQRGDAVPTDAMREGAEPGHLSFRALSKGAVRTLQTAFQHNGQGQQRTPPPLRQGAPEGGEGGRAAARAAATGGVYGVRLERPRAETPPADDGGPAGRPTRSWGHAVSSEVAGFAARRMAPWLRRQHTHPAVG